MVKAIRCISLIFSLVSSIGLSADPRALRVVMDNNYPPYVFLDDEGQPRGLLVDTWKAWEKANGQKVIIIATEWSNALATMDAGGADVIDTVFKTPERQQKWSFSAPWVDIPVVIYVDARITGIKELSLLNGFHVAVKTGDAVVGMLRDAGIQSFDEFSSYADIIQAAREHKINVFCMDQPPARYFLYHNGIEHDFNETILLSTGQFHRAVHRDRPEILHQIEAGFSAIPQETLTRLQETWLGSQLKDTGLPATIVWALAAGISLLVILLSAVLILRRLVRQRTQALSGTVTVLQNSLKANEESEERYHSLMAESIDGIMLTDELGIITDWNRSMEIATGYSDTEAIGLPVWHMQALLDNGVVIKEGMIESVRAAILDRLQTGNALALQPDEEHRITMKSGDRRWMQVSSFLVRTRIGWRLSAIFRDVTLQHRASQELEEIVQERTAALSHALADLETMVHELQSTQKQLVEAEKLAALGSLVAGIAHEVNTPLGNSFTMGTFIRQRLESLQGQLAVPEPPLDTIRALVGEISSGHKIELDNLQRSAELIQTFKLVASDQSSDKFRSFNLHTYVEEVIQTLHPRLKNSSHRIEIEGDRTVEITTIPGKIAQIITNLVVNSLDHGFDVKTGGTIRIKLGVAKGMVRIDYRDDGVGMSPEVLAHIWEPFFTTRRGQGGTGLGLHIIHGIVTQVLQGQISCFSILGEGVHFSISFPEKTSQHPTPAG